MKNKATVIFGYITFIALLILLIFLLYTFYSEIFLEAFFSENEYQKFSFNGLLEIIPILFLVFSALFYLIATKFWLTKPKELQKISLENEVLKKQIEQKELKNRLQEDKK